MNKKLISILIGLVVVVSTGLIVYQSKQYTETYPTEVKDIEVVTEDNLELNEKDSAVVTPKASVTSPKPIQPSGISMSEVSTHNTRTSCWSVINGNVYDLTSWIPNHPGGERNILSICGIDGSGAYNGKHGSKSKPAKFLFGFKIGTFAN